MGKLLCQIFFVDPHTDEQIVYFAIFSKWTCSKASTVLARKTWQSCLYRRANNLSYENLFICNMESNTER
jgi:hypothetical protein